MNERVRTSINVMIRLFGKHNFLPSFANEIKNDKMSFEIHIIVFILKTE